MSALQFPLAKRPGADGLLFNFETYANDGLIWAGGAVLAAGVLYAALRFINASAHVGFALAGLASRTFLIGGDFRLALVPVLAGVALRLDEHRQFALGGEHARSVRGKVTPSDLLARARGVRAPKVDETSYLIGADEKRRPLRVPLARHSGRHQLLLGATGCGKTTTLLTTVSRHIAAAFGAVVIDLKGDPQVISGLERACIESGRNLEVFTLDGGYHWNPLERGDRSELKDKLIGSEEFSERHYEAMYERYLINLFRAVELEPALRRLDKVVELLEPDVLRTMLRSLGAEGEAEQIKAYVNGLDENQKRQLHGLRDRLSLLLEGASGHLLLPSPEFPANDIDLWESLKGGAVVCFSLDSSRYGSTARLIANLIAQDLKSLVGWVQQCRAAGDERPGAIVAIDEFSALDSDNLAGLFQRGRSAGVSLVLSTQEIADLRSVSEDFADQVLANCEVLIAGRQNVPASAELIAEYAGTRTVWNRTYQTGHKGPGPKPLFDFDGQLGSKRRVEEFRVHPNVIKGLGVGEAVVISKNPHEVSVVRVAAD